MNPFREITPIRTYTIKHTNYRDYKVPLAKDFKNRCGYTNCSDTWFGGRNNFHIDHFIPWKKHTHDLPHLKTDYSNLVYCCSYVNILKSNDEGLYLDPCNIDYNEHFYRDDVGNIFPVDNSESAKYMYQKLKLYLKRYGIIWLLDQLEAKKEQLFDLMQKYENQEIKDLYIQIDRKYVDYKKYLNTEL
jgi:hypothetical protein